MGPNGSGKSTLAYAIAGHPKYTVTAGTVTLDGEDVLAMTVDERARAGLFLAMQYPVEVPGVSVSNFLRTAMTADPRRGAEAAQLRQGGQRRDGGLGIDPQFAERSSTRASPAARRSATRSSSWSSSSRSSPCSTRPTPASTSTRCKVVSEGVNRSAPSRAVGVLLITHYTRILRYIKPDFVHVFVGGPDRRRGRPGARRRARERGLRGVHGSGRIGMSDC